MLNLICFAAPLYPAGHVYNHCLLRHLREVHFTKYTAWNAYHNFKPLLDLAQLM